MQLHYNAACPLKGKCHYECIVYKVEVYSCRPKNSRNNVSSNDKKRIRTFYPRTFQN